MASDTVSLNSNEVFIRHFRSDEVDLLYKITSNTELMKFSGGPLSRDTCRKIFQEIIAYDKKKGGWWAIFNKSSFEFAGYFGLIYDSKEDAAEVFSYVLPEYQKKKLSEQILETCHRYGEETGISSIIAHNSSENKSGKKILRSAGMKFKKLVFRKGKSFELYSY